MKPTRVLVTVDAGLDLDAIDSYLSTHNPTAARRFLAASDAAIDLIASNPEIGYIRHFRNPILRGVRSLAIPRFRTYVLYYQVADGTVYLLRVLHGARDVRKVLRHRSS